MKKTILAVIALFLVGTLSTQAASVSVNSMYDTVANTISQIANASTAGLKAAFFIATSTTGVSTFAGSVAIGTTSASQKLVVESTSTLGTNLVLSNSDTGGHQFNLLSSGSGNGTGAGTFSIIDVTAGNLRRFFINASGKIGINTTSPLASLHLNGSSLTNGDLDYSHRPLGNASIPTLSNFVNSGISSSTSARQFMSSLEFTSQTGSTDTGNIQDRVTQYASIVATSSATGEQSGDVWVYNTLMNLATSSGNYNAQMYELDMNNHVRGSTATISELYASGTKRIGAMTFTGTGDYINDYALSVETANPSNMWNKAIAVSDAAQAAFWNSSGATYAFYTKGGGNYGFYENGSNGSAANYFKHKVGINNSSPSWALDIAGGDVNIDTGKFYRANSTGILGVDTNIDTIVRAGSTKGIGFSASGETIAQNGALYIRADNNIGINTASSTQKLQINGGLRLTGNFMDSVNATGTLGQVLISTGTSTLWTSTSSLGFSSGSGSGTVNSGITGQLAYFANNGTTVSGTSTLFIASNGSIGVGTTTPVEALSVSGNLGVANTINLNGATSNITLNPTGAATDANALIVDNGRATFGYDGARAYIGSGASRDIVFKPGAVEKIRISSAGLLGVGNTNPLATLDIIAATGTNPISIASSSGTSIFTISKSSFVGIGTTSPVSTFAVTGTSTLNGITNISGALTAASTLAVTGTSALTGAVTVTGGLTANNVVTNTVANSTGTGWQSNIASTLTMSNANIATAPTAIRALSIRSIGSTTAANTGTTTGIWSTARYSAASGTMPFSYGVAGAVENTGTGTTSVGYSIFGIRPLVSLGTMLQRWAGGFDGSVWVADNLSVGTTSIASAFQVASSTGTSTVTVDSASATKGSCLEMKDADGVGYTYVTFNNGAMTATTTSCK